MLRQEAIEVLALSAKITRLGVAFQVENTHPALINETFAAQLIFQFEAVLSLVTHTPHNSQSGNLNLRRIVLEKIYALDTLQKNHFLKNLAAIKNLVIALQAQTEHVIDKQATTHILNLALDPSTELLFNQLVEHAAQYAELVSITKMQLSDLLALDESLQIAILQNAMGLKELIEMIRYNNAYFSFAELMTGSVDSRIALCEYANELVLLCSVHPVNQRAAQKKRRRTQAALFESADHPATPNGTFPPEILAQIVNLQDQKDILMVALQPTDPATHTILQRLVQQSQAQSSATARATATSQPAPQP
jgi:hypothetical protein